MQFYADMIALTRVVGGDSTTTGMNVVTAPVAAIAALRALFRQLWTMLALMPCDIAILATEAPGWLHSARILVFSSGLCRRRVRLRVEVIVSIMVLMDTIVVATTSGSRWDCRVLTIGSLFAFADRFLKHDQTNASAATSTVITLNQFGTEGPTARSCTGPASSTSEPLSHTERR